MSEERPNGPVRNCRGGRNGEIVRTAKMDDGRWGLSRVTAGMGVAKIGITPPFFLDKGVNIRGESYAAELKNNPLPSMTNIAYANGKAKVRSPQQDGAKSHGVPAVRALLKKCPGTLRGRRIAGKEPGPLRPRLPRLVANAIFY